MAKRNRHIRVHDQTIGWCQKSGERRRAQCQVTRTRVCSPPRDRWLVSFCFGSHTLFIHTTRMVQWHGVFGSCGNRQNLCSVSVCTWCANGKRTLLVVHSVHPAAQLICHSGHGILHPTKLKMVQFARCTALSGEVTVWVRTHIDARHDGMRC